MKDGVSIKDLRPGQRFAWGKLKECMVIDVFGHDGWYVLDMEHALAYPMEPDQENEVVTLVD